MRKRIKGRTGELNPEEDNEEDNGEISIHALKEVTNNKIMKVEGRSNGEISIVCLICF